MLVQNLNCLFACDWHDRVTKSRVLAVGRTDSLILVILQTYGI